MEGRNKTFGGMKETKLTMQGYDSDSQCRTTVNRRNHAPKLASVLVL
jgi:hypothetical protein